MGSVIGEGSYARVYCVRDETGKLVARKRVPDGGRNALKDFETEAAVLDFGQRTFEALAVKVCPRLFAWRVKPPRACAFDMELFEADMQTWISEGRPSGRDLALALAQVVVAIGALNCSDIRSNDAFFRNVLVRRRDDAGAAQLVKYVLADGASVILPQGRFECAIADFGLASGRNLPFTHAQRAAQFKPRKGEMCAVHPLENGGLQTAQLHRIDFVCLFVSLSRVCANEGGRLRLLPQWTQYLKAQLARDGTCEATVGGLLRHEFVSRHALLDVVPDRVLRLGALAR